jgi:hypothetical protein
MLLPILAVLGVPGALLSEKIPAYQRELHDAEEAARHVFQALAETDAGDAIQTLTVTTSRSTSAHSL